MEVEDRVVFGGRYRLGPLVGQGGFVDVFLGEDLETGAEVAVKIELKISEGVEGREQLEHEADVYWKLQGGEGMPVLKWFGSDHNLRILVMELLGPNLEDLFTLCSRRFSLKTVLLLGDQMLRRLEYVHGKGLLHGDIKPENFLMGLGKASHVVFLVDFGFSKLFVDPETRRHVPYTEDLNIAGTAHYASIHSHKGREQSRRDDMESLAYVFVYFVKGSLPWHGIKTGNMKKRLEMIVEKKVCTPVSSVCKGIPEEFCQFLNYCRTLEFEKEPDYHFLRQLFWYLYRNLGYKRNFKYDWNKLRDCHP